MFVYISLLEYGTVKHLTYIYIYEIIYPYFFSIFWGCFDIVDNSLRQNGNLFWEFFFTTNIKRILKLFYTNPTPTLFRPIIAEYYANLRKYSVLIGWRVPECRPSVNQLNYSLYPHNYVFILSEIIIMPHNSVTAMDFIYSYHIQIWK